MPAPAGAKGMQMSAQSPVSPERRGRGFSELHHFSEFFRNPKLWFHVLLYFFAGAGTLAGVQLCQFAYKKKYSAG
jgi:hypothetical protein